MLVREDMLELTRRMTPSRNCFSRVAGSFRDEEGNDDGSFNTYFSNLKGDQRDVQLEIAKTIPFSETNVELKEYDFPPDNQKGKAVCQLLKSFIECDLKNDIVLETFYDYVGERFCALSDYAIYIYHGIYDIPVKGRDKQRQGESEEVYSFIICAICPLTAGEPGKPECGFLYPSFSDRSADTTHIAVYDANPYDPHLEFLRDILAIE